MMKNILIMTSVLICGALTSCSLSLSAINGADQRFDATIVIVPVEESK